MKIKFILIGLIITFSSCTPNRWKNATIQEINCAGEVINEYKDVRIRRFQGQWVRFETDEGQITLTSNFRVLYKPDKQN